MGEIDPAAAALDPVEERRGALLERLDEALTATLELCAIYLGERLGYYQILAAGALTSTELAAHTGTHERYAREWLEQQATAGILVGGKPRCRPVCPPFRPAARPC